MVRPTRACAALAAALSLVASARATDAQLPTQAPTINGQTLAPLQPLIIRADAPIPLSGNPDPSLANAFNFTTPTGVNLNGVGNFIIPDPEDAGFIFSCTASRIGPHSILTAAHCVTDGQTGQLLSTSGQAFARFIMPGSTNAAPQYFFTPDATSIIVNPGWHGFDNPTTYLATDLAVVNFATDLPSYVTTYGLYTDVPLGLSATLAGFGTYGAGTGPTDFDFGRRWGTNTIDYIDTDPRFDDYLDLYADFDGPNGTFNTFCQLGISCNTGIFSEAATSEGDSGGPLFVNGLIAGVTSFGTAVCDPARSTSTNCVPLVADPNRPFDSFGSLMAWAPVFANTSFISAAVAPEPSTIALVGTGLLFLGGVVRRRRR